MKRRRKAEISKLLSQFLPSEPKRTRLCKDTLGILASFPCGVEWKEMAKETVETMHGKKER